VGYACLAFNIYDHLNKILSKKKPPASSSIDNDGRTVARNAFPDDVVAVVVVDDDDAVPVVPLMRDGRGAQISLSVATDDGVYSKSDEYKSMISGAPPPPRADDVHRPLLIVAPPPPIRLFFFDVFLLFDDVAAPVEDFSLLLSNNAPLLSFVADDTFVRMRLVPGITTG
jgi:hypothetical protein